MEYQPPRYAQGAAGGEHLPGGAGGGDAGRGALAVAGLAGMLAMIATGCVDARIAFRVDWRVVLLIGSMMALGVAMEVSGAGMFLGDMAAELGEYGGPRHGAGRC